MLSSHPIGREVSHLRHDAARMLKDLTRLSEALAAKGRDGSAKASEIATNVEGKLQPIGKTMRHYGKRTGHQIRSLDGVVHERPYPFVIGALCFGVALGFAAGR